MAKYIPPIGRVVGGSYDGSFIYWLITKEETEYFAVSPSERLRVGIFVQIDDNPITFEVRDGILNHVWGSTPSTLEGKIVQFADRIAYINHDIDDACRAGVISPDDIPNDIRDVLGSTHSGRINTMVTAVIESSLGKNEVSMKPEVLEKMLDLRKYLFDNVYFNPKAKGEEKKAEILVEKLYY